MTGSLQDADWTDQLGLKAGMRSWFLNMPAQLEEQLSRKAPAIHRLDVPDPPVEFAFLFVRHCAALDCELRMLLPLIGREAIIWIGWPGGVPDLATDIDAQAVRRLAHPLHLADVTRCSLDGQWSGMKLVPASEAQAGRP